MSASGLLMKLFSQAPFQIQSYDEGMELYLFNRCKIRDKGDLGHKHSFILDTHFEPTRISIFLMVLALYST